MVRAKRLSGLNPLAYMGVEPDTPLQFTVQNRAPGERDYSNWNIGSIWLHDTPQDVYMLVAKDNLIATWILFGSSSGGLQTLTGNMGGPVSPDGAMNIDLKSTFSPLNINGNPATNTLTLSSDGTIAVSYNTSDGETATAVLNELEILGGIAVDTSAVGNEITIEVDGTVATQYNTDGSPAFPINNILNVVGAGGITTSGSGNTLTITTSGTVATQYDADVGSATPAAGILEIRGGFFINTTGSGNTVTVNMDNLGGPGVVVTDSSGNLSSINGTDGQLLIAATGADPAWATVTSGDASITITGGANTLDLVANVSVTVNAGDNINISSPPTNTVNLNETIHWPHTNGAGTSGVIFLGGASGVGGDRFIHDYGIDSSDAQNAFLGRNAGNFTLDTTDGKGNVGIGTEALTSLTTGHGNVAVGAGALKSSTEGSFSVAVGNNALASNTTSFGNVCVGFEAGTAITTGEYNVAIGYQALSALTTGSNNIIMGNGAIPAGSAYTSSESNNICIGNTGVIGESDTIRIGTDGGGVDGAQTRCFIKAIYGNTVSGGITVYINSDGQLGTTTSSARFKNNIADMGSVSEAIYTLRPVSFVYKEDETREKQYGLIAEEVHAVLPEIVTRDKEGVIDAVQYHKLIPMLLNEAQKLDKRVASLEQRVLHKGSAHG